MGIEVRLKQLREEANYSQKQLASMLKTTQQTIGRWESGKAEPNLVALRDLALIFGTSVDDLLGLNPLRTKPASTTYHILNRKERDGFWGHVGIKFGDAPSKWFPVTIGAVEHVAAALSNLDGEDRWIGFETLANKFVALRPAAVRKIWLLDDACDQPDGDWEVDLPYQGLPLEVYRAFDKLQDIPIDETTWRVAARALATAAKRDPPPKEYPKPWRALIDQLRTEFNDASDAFLNSVAEHYAEERLFEEEQLYRYLHYTTVYFTTGGSESFWAEGSSLRDLAFDIDLESVPGAIRLEHFGGSAEPYYITNKLSAIVMPLLDLIDAYKEEEEREKSP